MRESDQHYDAEQLKAWYEDRLSADDAERLEQHLANCELCATRLDEQHFAADAMLRRLRSQSSPGSELDLQEAIRSTKKHSTSWESVRLPRSIHTKSLYTTGSVGRIWRAFDRDLGREVAIKEILPKYAKSPTVRARFRREARIVAQLQHPGLVPVYSYYEDADHCFYTMRFVEGTTLGGLIKLSHSSHEPPSIDRPSLVDLVTHLTKTCEIVSHAHSHGIIHRDLKGENVIVRGNHEVVVVDWGLAKQIDIMGDSMPPIVSEPIDSKLSTIRGQILGTPAYVSPEQVRGDKENVSYRSDVYSLGVILYYLLCGRLPFESESMGGLLKMIVEEPPTPPGQIAKEVPAPLESICLAALEKNQANRPSSVAEFRSALATALATV